MNKAIWKSKTFWGCILLTVGGLTGYFTGDTTWFTEILKWVGGPLAVFGIRDAL